MSYPWHKEAHKIFVIVIIFQWLASIVIGFINDLALMSIVTSSFIAIVPLVLIAKMPDAAVTRHSIAISTQALTALHIQQFMGLTEMHFEIFTLLAFLSIYRDWKIIVTGVLTVAVHHFSFFYLQLAETGLYIFEDGHVTYTFLAVHAFFAVSEGIVLFFVTKGMEKESLGNLNLSRSVENIMQDGKIWLDNKATGDSDAILAFNAMIDSLSGLILVVKDSSNSANTYSNEISTSSAETVNSLKDNANEVSHITTALGQISEANTDVAKNVDGISSLSVDVRTETTGAQNLIDQNAAQAAELQSDMDSAAQSIKELSDMVGNIETAMASIRSIADQTNLLALNAAIESARAGEHGRGFAVVADEVRQLATKTSENTEDISKITEKLSAGAKKSVSVMSECSNRVLETVQSSNLASKKIGEINHLIDSLNQNITTVAASAEEHSLMSNTIADSAKTLEQSTDKQVSAMTENQTKLIGLHEQIKNLNQELLKFES